MYQELTKGNDRRTPTTCSNAVSQQTPSGPPGAARGKLTLSGPDPDAPQTAVAQGPAPAAGRGGRAASAVLNKRSIMSAVTTGHGDDAAFNRKIGRNEQCPCGSGKKYKRCHGRAA